MRIIKLNIKTKRKQHNKKRKPVIKGTTKKEAVLTSDNNVV